MNKKLTVQPPPDQPWVGLIDALTWIAFDHSFSLEVLLSPNRPTEGELREIHWKLQDAWENLADCASAGRIIVRGKRRCERRSIIEREERCLSADDLRNCRHLSWPRDGGGSRKTRVEWFADASVSEETWAFTPQPASNQERIREFFSSDTSSAVEGWSEDFARATEHDGFDYVDVVVSWTGLMQVWPIRGKRRTVITADKERAERWLHEALAVRPAPTTLKADLRREIELEFGLTPHQSDQIWRKVAPKHAEWHRKRGRRKKGEEIKLGIET